MSPAQLITQQFPNRASLTLIEAGAALGMAAKTAYNLNSQGRFPVRVSRVGKRPVVHLHDLITFLEVSPSANDGLYDTNKPKKKGRPTKADALRKAGLI